MSNFDFAESDSWGDDQAAGQTLHAARRHLDAKGKVIAAHSANYADSRGYTCVLSDGTREIDLLFMCR